MAAQPPHNLGLELTSPPTDGVTGLRFSGDSGLLLATSWDAGVRLYDADPVSETSALRQHFTVGKTQEEIKRDLIRRCVWSFIREATIKQRTRLSFSRVRAPQDSLLLSFVRRAAMSLAPLDSPTPPFLSSSSRGVLMSPASDQNLLLFPADWTI